MPSNCRRASASPRCLVVKEGEVVEYVPRADRVAEVIALIAQAIGPVGVINAPRTEYGWRAKGRPRSSAANGGKGGIRTRSSRLYEASL